MWKLLRDDILKVLITRKTFCNYICWWMLTRFMVIILQIYKYWIIVLYTWNWRRKWQPTPIFLGFPCDLAGKESACNAGDLDLIPGLGRSPGEGKGCPLQYSGLENSTDSIVHGVAKSWTRLSHFHFTLLHHVPGTRYLQIDTDIISSLSHLFLTLWSTRSDYNHSSSPV